MLRARPVVELSCLVAARELMRRMSFTPVGIDDGLSGSPSQHRRRQLQTAEAAAASGESVEETGGFGGAGGIETDTLIIANGGAVDRGVSPLGEQSPIACDGSPDASPKETSTGGVELGVENTTDDGAELGVENTTDDGAETASEAAPSAAVEAGTAIEEAAADATADAGIEGKEGKGGLEMAETAVD